MMKTMVATIVIMLMRVVMGGDGDFCQDDSADGCPALLPSGKG